MTLARQLQNPVGGIVFAAANSAANHSSFFPPEKTMPGRSFPPERTSQLAALRPNTRCLKGNAVTLSGRSPLGSSCGESPPRQGGSTMVTGKYSRSECQSADALTQGPIKPATTKRLQRCKSQTPPNLRAEQSITPRGNHDKTKSVRARCRIWRVGRDE
jgi:hypothetical protein